MNPEEPLRVAFDALNRGDLDVFLDLVHPEVVQGEKAVWWAFFRNEAEALDALNTIR